jgi:hypothetical protein
MLYIAEVEVRVYPYMDDSFIVNKKHTVEADSTKEAEDKIKAHYESKSESHGGTNYSVYSIDFFEHIS